MTTRILLLLVLLSNIACAIPWSRPVQVSLSGQLRTASGAPLAGKTVELILPAEYGLQEMDTEYLNPASYEKRTQRATVTTDALGTFDYTFQPTEFTTALWLLPPIGAVPGEPPAPYFHLRFAESPQTVLTVLVNENGTTYGLRDANSGEPITTSPAELPARVDGTVLREKRGDMRAVVADFDVLLRKPQSPLAVSPTRQLYRSRIQGQEVGTPP